MSVPSYEWLMQGEYGDPLDRHIFASCIALVRRTACGSVASNLGLSAEHFAALIGRYFPHAVILLRGLSSFSDGYNPLRMEEADLRHLLLNHRADGSLEEVWLAHIIARRSLSAGHLWQELGLISRIELNLLMIRHFPHLAERNECDMRWKRFLYHQLDGNNCGADHCQECSRYDRCHGSEDGPSLLTAPVPPYQWH